MLASFSTYASFQNSPARNPYCQFLIHSCFTFDISKGRQKGDMEREEGEVVFIYVPFGSRNEAEDVGHYLIEKKLAGCYNLFNISSCYWWEGKVTDDTEFVLIVKTLPEKEERVREVIKEKHPYTVPCIASWRVRVNEEYLEWMRKSIEG